MLARRLGQTLPSTSRVAIRIASRTQRQTPATVVRTNVRAANLHSSSVVNSPAMFCFQCEQTENATGCTTVGVCGKQPSTSRLQDLVIHGNKILGWYMHELIAQGVRDQEVANFIYESTFSTLTNVNFDDSRFVTMLNKQQELINRVRGLWEKLPGTKPTPPASFTLVSQDVAQLTEQAKQYGVLERKAVLGDDYVGLQELIVYGLKGMSAYEDHCLNMTSFEDRDHTVTDFLYECFAFLNKTDATVPELLAMALKVGEINLRVMANLEGLHTSKFGNPVPNKVRATGVTGKGILVSGHDINDLYNLLVQTEGTGVNVYTHGEMLPAHGYPELKKFKHFVGNYGGAWQHQKIDFATFPGPIILTSNCLIEPMKSYRKRIYTKGAVGWPGIPHITGQDYSAIIKQAQELDGFDEDEPERYFTTGFGKNTVLSVAPQVVEAVNSGAIKHFFMIGGCDGAEGERSYFRDVAKLTPADSVILTLACGKYRFNDCDFGTVAGIPRMLDMGQCNDSYGAIQVAVALANAFKTDVNSLPLSFVVSWFEQKAVAVLLTLLHLGIRGIYLGPNLPAFCTPTMLSVLVENWHLRQISDPAADMKDMLANKK